MTLSNHAVRFGLKPIVFLASLGPFVYLVWAAWTGHLSANPLADLTNETGVWTLRLVCVTLAITPLRKLTGWNVVIKFRRMAGLFACFYGPLHLLTHWLVHRFSCLSQPAVLSLHRARVVAGVTRQVRDGARVRGGREGVAWGAGGDDDDLVEE